MKMKYFGLPETKLFHFHRIFKNGGVGRGVQANPPEPPLDLPLLICFSTMKRGMQCIQDNTYNCSTELHQLVGPAIMEILRHSSDVCTPSLYSSNLFQHNEERYAVYPGQYLQL